MSSMRPIKTYAKKHSNIQRDGVSISASDISPRSGQPNTERPRKRRHIDSPSSSDANETFQNAIQIPAQNKGPITALNIPSGSAKSLDYSSTGSEVRKDGHVIRQRSARPMTPPRSISVGKRESPSRTSYSVSEPDEASGGRKMTSQPKDLASIFDVISPSPTYSRNHHTPKSAGLTKKMLSRARTEVSIEDSPSKSAHSVSRSRSMIETVLPPQSPTRTQHSSERIISSSQELTGQFDSNLQGKERKLGSRTYAGSSRSFLVPLPASSLATSTEGMGSSLENFDEDRESLRDSYSELTKRWGVDNSENDPQDDCDADGSKSNLYNQLYSITDLRSKGETRRFLDEAGYLIEGLASDSLSVRRSTAAEIITKLCDQDFRRKAKAAGLFLQLWAQLRGAGAGSGDKVLDTILCCFISLVSEDRRDISTLADKGDFVETLFLLFEMHRQAEPFQINDNHGKSAKSSVNTQENSLLRQLSNNFTSKTTIVNDSCQLSTRLLISNILASTTQLAFSHIGAVVDSLIREIAYLTSRISAYESGLPLFPVNEQLSHDTFCSEHVHNCLIILDSYLILMEHNGDKGDVFPMTKSEMKKHYKSIANDLVVLITAVDIIERTHLENKIFVNAAQCSDLAFRVLVNLTDSNGEWCECLTTSKFAFPVIIRQIVYSHQTIMTCNLKKVALTDNSTLAHMTDRLCLALGLLTNLVQEQCAELHVLQSTRFDSSCKYQRTCLSGCRCPNGKDVVAILIDAYNSLSREQDDPEFDLHFLRGHIAVLLALLTVQDPQLTIVNQLPGASSKKRLEGLIESVSEFSSLYATLATGQQSDPERSPIGSDSISLNIVSDILSSLTSIRVKLARST